MRASLPGWLGFFVAAFVLPGGIRANAQTQTGVSVEGSDHLEPVAPSRPEGSATRPSKKEVEINPRALLRQAIDLYIIGRYQEAAERLRPLVEARVLRDTADQSEALRVYGISLFLAGAVMGAERAFRELLRVEPPARLDPRFVRPEVVVFFESIRLKHLEEIDRTQRRGVGRVMINLLPGLGQIQNGHRRKGYCVMGGALAFGITSLVTGGLLYSWRDDTGQMSGHEKDYQPVFFTNVISFSLFLGVVAYGITDGLYYYYKVTPSGAQPEKPASSVLQNPTLVRF